MAKSNLIKIALVVALTMVAGSAYASSNITGIQAIGSGSFVPSNNVQVGVAAADSMFSAHAKHLNGDRIIAMVSTDAKLYFSSGASVGSTVAAPAASNTYSNLSGTTGWKSM